VLPSFHETRTDHLFLSLTATFGLLLIYWLFGHDSLPNKNKMESHKQKVKYEAVTGYFLQDDPKTDPNTFEYVCHSSSTHNYISPI
jgi:hypothetical protein